MVRDPLHLDGNVSVLYLASMQDWRAFTKALDSHLANQAPAAARSPRVHISATSSLQSAIADNVRDFAAADMLLEPSLNLRLILKHLVFPAGTKQELGFRLSLLTALEDHLRADHLRDPTTTSVPTATALWRAHGDLLDAILTLEENGIGHEDFSDKVDGAERLSLDAWRSLAQRTQNLQRRVRDHVWEAKPSQLHAALSATYNAMMREKATHQPKTAPPPATGPLTVVFHGLYYYTPKQWAFFRQMTRIPEVHCVFVVHDDGQSRELETWRHFFPTAPKSAAAQPTPAAAALRLALSGRPPGEPNDQLKLMRFRNAGEFLRDEDVRTALRLDSAPDDEPKRPRAALHAADHATARRFFRLMNFDQARSEADLGALPAGRLLLKLHDAVHTNVADGTMSFQLKDDIVMDALESQYLWTPSEAVTRDTPSIIVYRQVRNFFTGCSTLASWLQRAEDLVTFSRDARALDDENLELIANRVRNPLRRFPWGDLNEGEAEALQEAFKGIARQLEELFGDPRAPGQRQVGHHIRKMHDLLQRGLRNVPQAEQDRVSGLIQKLFAPEDTSASLPALVSTIRGLLSPKEDEDAQDGPHGAVKPLRALDEYLVRAPSGPLHLMTMSDVAFPKRVDPVPWPFALDSISPKPAQADALRAKQLLQARRDASVDSDLYLLHLALQSSGSVHSARTTVTLSWVEAWDRKEMGPSPFVNLLKRLDRAPGGVPIQHVDKVVVSKRRSRATAVPVADPQGAGPTRVPRGAVASAHHCPRRFVLQWVLGRTAAFTAAHHHEMLYGNVRDLLEPASNAPNAGMAARAVPFMTPAGKDSSKAKSRVKTGTKREWVLTLRGGVTTRDGNPRTDPISMAYQYAHAVNGVAPPKLDMHLGQIIVNPEHPPDCTHCPVRAACLLGHLPTNHE